MEIYIGSIKLLPIIGFKIDLIVWKSSIPSVRWFYEI